MLRRLSIVSLLAAGALFGVAASQAAQPDRSTLPGSAPAWANAHNRVGTADPNGAVGFRVYLGWQQESAAVALAKAVSDPANASYGRYLTPAQFRQQFAPSQGQVGAVQSWLRDQGFSIDHTPTNNHYVSAEGTVAQAQAAFDDAVRGLHGQRQDRSLAVRRRLHPELIGTPVEGVLGLDDSADFVQPDSVIDKNAPPSAGFRNAPPLSDFWAQLVSLYPYPTGFTDVVAPPTAPWSIRGHTPAQIKGAYGISHRL